MGPGREPEVCENDELVSEFEIACRAGDYEFADEYKKEIIRRLEANKQPETIDPNALLERNGIDPTGWTWHTPTPTPEIKQPITARPIDDWHEDVGDVLWWEFPVSEPPYCGTPIDVDWPGYHTHWTPIVIPEAPKEGDTLD